MLRHSRFVGLLIFWIVVPSSVMAEDWPTFRHDQRRSGYTTEHLPAPALKKAWTWDSPLPPVSAWPDSARWDAYAKLDGLRSMRDYDPVFHPIVVDDYLLFGSNADDSVHCLNLSSGDEIWTSTASAPIRVAPIVHQDKVIFGSDDGAVYCVRIQSGELIWKKRLVPAETFINDGRVCSFQPIRTGVLLDEAAETLIVGSGLFPWKDSYLFGLKLDTGAVAWERNLGPGWTIEGPMLLSETHIISPQGRAPPKIFSRSDGTAAGTLPGGGGSFALLTDNGDVFHGPGNKGGWLSGSTSSSQKKLGEFSDGICAAASPTRLFVATLDGVSCIERGSSQLLWETSLRSIQEMIVAGDHVFLGLDGLVCCLDSKSGEAIWEHTVNGRAIGLAVANGHLVVATDRGSTTVFGEATDVSPELNTSRLASRYGYSRQESMREETLETGATERYVEDRASGLLERWLFKASQADADEDATKLSSAIEGGTAISLPDSAVFLRAQSEDYWLLEKGQDCEVAPSFRSIPHPKRRISVVATVRIDKPQSWGGLASMSQDNGSYEKGWILGFTNDRFGFAVNGKSDAHDKLTWVTNKTPFVPFQWYHVAATYDGQTCRLYVNGELVNSSTEQGGDIDYPNEAAFVIGSYKDKDEHFYTSGRLNEIAIYDSVLSASDIAARFKERQRAFGKLLDAKQPKAPSYSTPDYLQTVETGLRKGPEIQFVEPGTAKVQFWTADKQDCKLKIVTGNVQTERIRVQSDVDGLMEEWLIKGIDSREQVRFTVELNGRESNLFECDGNFDYSRRLPQSSNDSPPTVLSSYLTNLIWNLGTLCPGTKSLAPRGIALVVADATEEHLVHDLAATHGMDVIWCVSDAEVGSLRAKIMKSGLYGRPISVVGRQEATRLPPDTVNLLVAVDHFAVEQAKQAARILEKVQPGGLLITRRGLTTVVNRTTFEQLLQPEIGERDGGDFYVFERRAHDGASSWTHMYGLPNNTAFAGEELGGAATSDRMQVRWAGRPGPRYQSDRGNRKSSPLTSQGRLYLQGLHRLIGMDAHNGTILWSWELPELARFNIPRDCANWCCDDKNLFVAVRDRCKIFDASTGELVTELPVWNPEGESFDWGYVARVHNLLLGSSVKEGASHVKFWGKEYWYDAKSGELANKVCSDRLFALDPKSGARIWDYQGGLIVNPTISQTADKIVFVESRSAQLALGESRRLGGESFWNSLHVVCLDVLSGKKIWETPAKPLHGDAAFYGVCTDDKYLIQSSKAGEFALYALDLQSGKMLWRGKYPWEADHHGKHLSRPAIVGNKIYLRPFTLGVANGEVLADRFPPGHQCGTYTASSNALFLRAGNLTMWDRESAAASSWERLRPDCWISTIPAEGMLLSPEGGGGCSCGGWIETSMGFGVETR